MSWLMIFGKPLNGFYHSNKLLQCGMKDIELSIAG